MAVELINPEVLEKAEALVEVEKRLAEVNDQASDIRIIRNAIEEDLAKAMKEKRINLPGLGTFERKWETQRNEYDHDALRRDLMRKAKDSEPLVDQATGEIESEWERAFRVLFECMSPSWKGTGLKVYDIDVDEYCHKERRRTVSVQGMKDESK